MAALGTLAVSCQKDNLNDPTTVVAENHALYRISYSVDGVTRHITLVGEEAWRAFLQRMIALAEEGHKVSFCNEESASRVVPTKETVVYTTSSSVEAQNWADKMTNDGYAVTIEYDRESGKYICTAIK